MSKTSKKNDSGADDIIRELTSVKKENTLLRSSYEIDIEKSKVIEEQLRTSNKKLEAIIFASPDGIGIASLDGKLKLVSDKLISMYGYTLDNRNEYLNKSIFDFLDPGQKEILRENINKLLCGEIEQTISEYQAVKSDGSIFYIEVNSTLLKYPDGKPDSILFVQRDITNRKKIEEAAKERENNFRHLFSNIRDVVYSVDADTKEFSYLSPSFERITGYSSEDIKKMGGRKKFLSQIVTEEKFAEWDNYLETLSRKHTTNDFTHHAWWRCKDGTLKCLQDHWIPIYKNGKLASTDGVLIDISERMLAESIIRRQNEELQKANTAKDKFFSIIGHDLKIPLQGLVGLTAMMAENIDNFSQTELAELSREMHSNSKNLMKLLQNLLDWSRMQQGMITFNPIELNLIEPVTQNIELLIKRGEQKGIELSFEIPSLQKVYADEAMLNSILRNLLSNAVKFTNQGGHVHIKSNEIENGMIEISVADNGIGMKHELLSKLFKLEEKSGRKGTDGESSTGLGLLLCKEFVEKHGGKIRVESNEGSGSTFYFTLHKHKNNIRAGDERQ